MTKFHPIPNDLPFMPAYERRTCPARLVSSRRVGMTADKGGPLGFFARLREEMRSMPVSLLVIYANISLYALCYQMQSPVQPELVKSLGAWRGTNSAQNLCCLCGAV